MKKITCRKCSKTWYVDDQNLSSLVVCPYCAVSILEKRTITTADSLDKAIYLAFQGLGESALSSPTRIASYIADIAPEMKKEVRILSHSFREEYFIFVRNAFGSDMNTAEKEINKLIQLLMDEEGLSESWASQLGDGYLGAIRLCHGIGLDDILLADVADCAPATTATAPSRTARQADSKTKNPAPFRVRDRNFVMDGTKLVEYTGSSSQVRIPNGITEIGPKAFYRNFALNSVTIPGSVHTIGEMAFARCTNLEQVGFAEGLQNIGRLAFFNCKDLQTLHLPDSVKALGNACFHSCDGLTHVCLSHQLAEIPEGAFDLCNSLDSVLIPSSVLRIGVNAFPSKTRRIQQT